MFKTEIDAKAFIATLSDIERRQLPYGVMLALNDTGFQVRQAWSDEIGRVFDRPAPWIQKSPEIPRLDAGRPGLATKDNLRVVVQIEDFWGGKGIPPGKTLRSEVTGGARHMKASEQRLGRFWVAGSGFRDRLDAYGNVPGSVVGQILSQLGLSQHVSGFLANQTETSRGRRLRRAKKKGTRGGEFFLVRATRGRLQAGVYERIRTGAGTTVRAVLFFVDKAPTYRIRFNPEKIARDVFHARFPTNFINRMSQAILTARH
jgi:hypothetical protein